MTELQPLRAASPTGSSSSDGLEWSSSPPANAGVAPMHQLQGRIDPTGSTSSATTGSNSGTSAGSSSGGGLSLGSLASFFSSPFASAAGEYGKSVLANNKVVASGGLGGWLRASALRYYFRVTQASCGRKIARQLLPFIYSDWTRLRLEGSDEGLIAASAGSNPAASFQPPHSDPNAPDMYLGLMSFLSFAVAMGYALGSVNQ